MSKEIEEALTAIRHGWRIYRAGSYEKKLYDISLKDGRRFYRCWPNAGYFTSQQGVVVSEKYVRGYRICDGVPEAFGDPIFSC